MEESFRLGRWAEKNIVSLQAVHITETSSIQEDYLSRTQVDNAEWQLHSDTFLEICNKFGTPSINLFVSSLKHKLPCYF